MITNFEIVDKNGNEICKGSKVKHNDNIYIAWFTLNFGIVFITEKTFYESNMLMGDHKYQNHNWGYRVRKYIDIVGHIYEN